MKYLKIMTVVCLLAMTAACTKTNTLELGDAAPDFTLKDINGSAVTLSDYEGKVIILDFFASWCPPCREEIPGFIALNKELKESGFAVIGVSMVSSRESREFANKMGIDYPVLVDDGSASRLYGPIRSIPMTYIIDKDFNVANIHIGYRTKEQFAKDAKKLIDAKKARKAQ